MTEPAAAEIGHRKRYALVGTGHRAQMYLDAIAGRQSGTAELVAWTDANTGRMDYYEARLAAAGVSKPARYSHTAVPEMIREAHVDTVIVTSPDYTHAGMIDQCLRAGADVIVEKPLTIDAPGVALIAAAIADTGRKVTVTFNYRYSPRNSALKEVIQSGKIGKVTSVHFEWVLDTVHGADYFRRWHRQKANSGGLAIHKASHHFDLVNWWIDDVPTRVYASGGLRFYGAENARARGLGERPERGTYDGSVADPFSLDLRNDERLRKLFLDNEHLDGYLRDRDVFDEGITIEDNLGLLVNYQGGPTMSYSLNAHSPWEGYRVAVNGTEGRVELEVVERGAVIMGEDGHPVVDPSAVEVVAGHGEIRPKGHHLVLQRHWEQAVEVPIVEGHGSHGGGDVMLLDDLFGHAEGRSGSEDPLGRPAGYLDGVRSVAVGIAANRSLETGQMVEIANLGLGVEIRRASSVGAGPSSGHR